MLGTWITETRDPPERQTLHCLCLNDILYTTVCIITYIKLHAAFNTSVHYLHLLSVAEGVPGDTRNVLDTLHRGGVVALSVERQTCDQEVVGSSLGWARGVKSGQVSKTDVTLFTKQYKLSALRWWDTTIKRYINTRYFTLHCNGECIQLLATAILSS